MTPIQAFRFMQSNKIDFKEAMLLEQMSTYPKEILTQRLVTDALQENISSPATTHKYLARLKRRKYVKEVQLKNQDGRCHFIVITDTGRELIKEWL